MPTTYEKIATTTLSSATDTVTLSSIPSTYTDLRAVFVGTSTAGANMRLRLNGDTASNYSNTRLYGRGATAASANSVNQTFVYLTDDGLRTDAHLYTVDLFSYAGSTFKTFLFTGAEDNNGSGSVITGVGLYRSTSAITSITFFDTPNLFAAGTTITLYGILKA